MKNFEELQENSLLTIYDKKHNIYFGGIFRNGKIEVIDGEDLTAGREIIKDVWGLEFHEITQ